MRYQISKITVTVNGYDACKPYLERGFVIDTISYWVSGTTVTYKIQGGRGIRHPHKLSIPHPPKKCKEDFLL